MDESDPTRCVISLLRKKKDKQDVHMMATRKCIRRRQRALTWSTRKGRRDSNAHTPGRWGKRKRPSRAEGAAAKKETGTHKKKKAKVERESWKGEVEYVSEETGNVHMRGRERAVSTVHVFPSVQTPRPEQEEHGSGRFSTVSCFPERAP